MSQLSRAYSSWQAVAAMPEPTVLWHSSRCKSVRGEVTEMVVSRELSTPTSAIAAANDCIRSSRQQGENVSNFPVTPKAVACLYREILGGSRPLLAKRLFGFVF